MKDIFYRKKQIVLFTAFFCCINMHSQWFDGAAAAAYHNMGSDALEMLMYDIISAFIAERAADFSELRYDKLKEVSNTLENQETKVKNFIDKTVRNYMHTKLYPLNPARLTYISNVSFGNVFTKYRLAKRYDKEIENIENYFDAKNPLTEGERMYLVLSAIAEVLQITLEPSQGNTQHNNSEDD